MVYTTFNNEVILWESKLKNKNNPKISEYALVEVTGNDENRRFFVLVHGWRTQYPILYGNGAIAYDYPELIPKYVKAKIEPIIRKKLNP